MNSTNRYEKLENLGLVRFKIEPDLDADLSYLNQACFADAQEQEYNRANNDGVWGIITEYKNSQNYWIHADSVWGFIGSDYENSGYDNDIKNSAVDELRNHIQNRCKYCKGKS